MASKPKLQNKQMHGRISPRRACNPCGYTIKMNSRDHRLLIYDVGETRAQWIRNLLFQYITDPLSANGIF